VNRRNFLQSSAVLLSACIVPKTFASTISPERGRKPWAIRLETYDKKELTTLPITITTEFCAEGAILHTGTIGIEGCALLDTKHNIMRRYSISTSNKADLHISCPYVNAGDTIRMCMPKNYLLNAA
jgi:hypothetical protein